MELSLLKSNLHFDLLRRGKRKVESLMLSPIQNELNWKKGWFNYCCCKRTVQFYDFFMVKIMVCVLCFLKKTKALSLNLQLLHSKSNQKLWILSSVCDRTSVPCHLQILHFMASSVLSEEEQVVFVIEGQNLSGVKADKYSFVSLLFFQWIESGWR